jgi:hypothetical protein
VLAAHAWSHEPLGRLGNLIDVAVTLQRADEPDVTALARRWGCARMWHTTRAAIGAVLEGTGHSAGVALWARHLRGIRERTVLEWHLKGALAPLWGLPPGRVGAAVVGEARATAKRDARERRRAKLQRTALALRHAGVARSEHRVALEARGDSFMEAKEAA